jgi:transposase-like protein
MAAVGRPSDYMPEHCEAVIALGKQGKSYTQIAVNLDIAKSTLYLWAEQHKEFSDALTRARECAQDWWESKGQEGLDADKFNASVWAKSMSCRFPDDYSDKNKVELTGKDGGAIQTTVTVEFVGGKDTTS